MERLSDADRARVAGVWEARARSEAEAAASFALCAARMAATAAGTEHARPVAALERAVADEQRHSALCRRVAAWYRGVAAPAAPVAPVAEPVYSGAKDDLRATLHVVSLCAINETLAGAFLELCLRDTTAEPARAAVRELLGDEIVHGRIGWALLAAVDGATRAAVAPYLAPLFAVNLRTWRTRTDGRLTDGRPAHGCPSAAATDAAILTAAAELVIPGLAHVGFDTRSLRLPR